MSNAQLDLRSLEDRHESDTEQWQRDDYIARYHQWLNDSTSRIAAHDGYESLAAIADAIEAWALFGRASNLPMQSLTLHTPMRRAMSALEWLRCRDRQGQAYADRLESDIERLCRAAAAGRGKAMEPAYRQADRLASRIRGGIKAMMAAGRTLAHQTTTPPRQESSPRVPGEVRKTITELVTQHPGAFRDAGRWLNEQYSVDAIMQRSRDEHRAVEQENERIGLHNHKLRSKWRQGRRFQAGTGCVPGEQSPKVLPEVLPPDELSTLHRYGVAAVDLLQVRDVARLAHARRQAWARRVLLLAWLATDADAEAVGLGLTVFERWPWWHAPGEPEPLRHVPSWVQDGPDAPTVEQVQGRHLAEQALLGRDHHAAAARVALLRTAARVAGGGLVAKQHNAMDEAAHTQRWTDPMTLAEIADKLKCSTPTAKKRLGKALVGNSRQSWQVDLCSVDAPTAALLKAQK